ncbi:MAG: glycosyltransferase family 2 protein [Planctomycetaceae bacterium]|jgi:glycosyltransferase involved in cell wall biosynthesis|nr:glycosyltransferase family 2 protein [Planctomycetaceae bacterium]
MIQTSDQASDKILVFIPMYNCGRQIPRVIAQFDDETQKIFSEILVVDNGSGDNSIQTAITAAKKLQHIKITITKNNENYSLGGSHKVAFNYAIENEFDYVVVLHGDDQGNIKDIIPLIKNNDHKNYDSMLGSRFMKNSKLIGYSNFRIFGNFVFNTFVSILFQRKITDMGSGLNLYKTDYLKNKFYLYLPNDLTFPNNMCFYGIMSQSKFCFFPLLWREDDQISNAKLFRQSRLIFGAALKFRFAFKTITKQKDNQFSRIKYKSDIIFNNKIQ